MKIVVCVKQVPDTWADKKLDPDTKLLDRASVDGVMNELDEYAIEESLLLREAHGGEVTVLTMGPDKASETVRKALSMGADDGIHLVDDGLAGSDAVATARAMAAVLSASEFDLVVAGTESTDARMSVVPAMLAELLGLPQLTFANKVEVDGTTVRVERVTEYGHDAVRATLPAVVSVVEKINEPRYPSFKGIMAAKKKPVRTLTLADAGIDPATVGAGASRTSVDEFADRPPREAGTVVTDEGDGATKIVEYLAAQKIV